MGSESHLCGWHLPPIETAKVAESRSKIKCTQSSIMSRTKYKTKPSEGEKFRHFTDAGRYIDEYRKTHTLAMGTTVEWGESSREVTKRTTKDAKFSKYIDIRGPEKKICLTGLPQLRPPPKHVIRTRAVHETFERSPFLTGVPHLPHLTLSGASKTVMKREIDRTDGQKHKKVQHKKKKERFPYLKPSSPAEPTRTM